MAIKIFQLIVAYQTGDDDAALELIDKFRPLLKKYAYALNREDSYEELQCYFLFLIKRLQQKDFHTNDDGPIIKYISKSIRNKYIALSKANHKTDNVDFFEDMPPSMSADVERKYSHNDLHESLLRQDMRSLLTENEYRILVALYFEQWSISEIALQLHKSRQAVNQAKKHALYKLRKAWKN